jgi:RNA polymerase sigma-70 factor (ECF subfamily)
MYGSTTDAISVAYHAHASELHRFATAKVRDSATAEDIVHEAFLRLAIESKAGRFPANPRAWLYRVAFNAIVSRGRRAAVAARHATTQQIRIAVDDTPETRYLEIERGLRIGSAMRMASPQGRSGLVMAAEGYSGREIAIALGRNETATRTLMHRARKVIRQRLADDDDRAAQGVTDRTRESARGRAA